jgi:hypothetical protein
LWIAFSVVFRISVFFKGQILAPFPLCLHLIQVAHLQLQIGNSWRECLHKQVGEMSILVIWGKTFWDGDTWKAVEYHSPQFGCLVVILQLVL